MEKISLLLSILALIISVAVAYYQNRKENERNKTNLWADYFNTIYKEHLIYKIPESRNYLQFVDNKLIGTEKLIFELNQIRKDSVFFRYNNNSYYVKLKTLLQNLEDYIVKTEEKAFEGGEQTDVMNRIELELDGIYDLISTAYVGAN